MHSSFNAALALALSALAIASPISNVHKRDFNCDVKNIQCCEQTLTRSEAAKQLPGLIVLDGLVGNIGLSCSPIGISLGSQCKSTPVCCSQVHQSGLINAGCSPLSVL